MFAGLFFAEPPNSSNAVKVDELTDSAELVIVKFPADPSSASGAAAENGSDAAAPPVPIDGFMHRVGLHARIRVPASDAGELLRTVRALAWVFLVLATLAIMVPSGMTATTIISVVAIELGGFVVNTLVLRHRCKRS